MKTLHFLIILTYFGLIKTILAEIKFKDCGSKNGAVKDIRIEGCSETPCSLVKGKEVNVKITFVPTITSLTLKPKFAAIVDRFSLNLRITEVDGCLLGANCPLEKDMENQLDLNFQVVKNIPSISGEVRMTLLGDRNKNIVCAQVAVKTVD